MGSPEHLVCFHCTTARVQVEDSDNEEETITGISWIAVDVKSNQVKKIILAVTCYGLLRRGFPCPAREKNSQGLWGRLKLEQYYVEFFPTNAVLICAELVWSRA